MKSLVSTFIGSLLIVSLLFIGGWSVFMFDRRPANFPSIHEHFLVFNFDWTAPSSLQVLSYSNGYAAGRANCAASIAAQNKAISEAHAQELQVEKQLLTAHNEAILARKKEAWTLAGIDKMHTTGNSCQKAEQIIRGVIK